jgi:predicted PurR-regulated permease PerM
VADNPDGGGWNNVIKVEVSWRGLILIGLAILAVVLFLRLWPVILLILFALIAMAALLPYVEWLVARGLHRGVAVAIVVIAVLAVLAGMIALLVPSVIEEIEDVRDNLPADARELEEFLADFGIDVELEERAEDIDWGNIISGRTAIDYTQRVFLVGFSIITIAALTVYLLLDAKRLAALIYRFTPDERRPDIEHVLEALGRVVGGYVRGQAITSASIGIYTLIVLLAVDVENPYAYAVLAAFADIIPLVGAFIAVIPAGLNAFQESPTKGLIVVGLLVLYQQFEDRVLVPRVYGQTLNLPPIVVFIAVLVGAQLLGIVGVLLAIPAAAAGRVFVELYLERRGLEPLNATVPEGEVAAPDDEA